MARLDPIVTRVIVLIMAVPLVVGGIALLSVVAPEATAAVSDDRVLPLGEYRSEKARRLATAHDEALRRLNAHVYHCLPWLEVHRHSIGFFKPKQAAADDRYLSIRVFVEQERSPQFAQLPLEQRGSSMFSRYVGPLLRKMADARLLADPDLDGFTVIVEWQKHGARREGRPVHETIAAFVDKASAAAYFSGALRIHELAARARVLAWDGETALGVLRVNGWDDEFVGTHKVANYELAPGVTCR
jgi:hypothetical protein